jgi:signal transduction histidine kinase
MSLLLRPTMLDDLGLVPAVKWYAREVSRTGPMVVDVRAESLFEDLPDEYRTCVYRIVQEAVRNASRHSGAQNVRISLDETPAADGVRVLRVSVHDDGRGFDPSQEAGLGILGIRERVTQLAGKLEVDSKPGSGTTIRISLPMPAGATGEYQEMRPFRTA